MIGQDVLFSHGVSDTDPKNHWMTPSSVFRPLYQEFGFTLDAAATKQSRVVPNYLGPGSRTDTRWWHDYVFDGADEVRFRKGRIRFERPDGAKAGAAPAPSALVVYRPNIKRPFPKVTAWVP